MVRNCVSVLKLAKELPMTELKGQCLCGGVQFEVAQSDTLDVCHCHMCRRWTGGVFIEMDIAHEDIEFIADQTLAWYDSSDWARRGFCKTCGSSLFYRMKHDGAPWAVLAGTLDLPPGLSIRQEIFVDQKPDYYDLAGDRPRLTTAETLARFKGQSDD